MLTQITQAFNNRGRMHLMSPTRKTTTEIFKEYDEDMVKHTNLFVVSMYNIICVNDIVIGLIADAFSKAKKTPIYKNIVKQKMNQVEKLVKSYEREVNRIVGNSEVNYANANDAFFTPDLADSIERLRLSFKQQLDKQKIAYSNELSWLEIARVMLEYAVSSRNVREKDLNKATRRGCIYFHMLDISKILVYYEMMMSNIHIGQKVNLNTPINHTMMARIDKLCTDAKRLEKTVNEMSQEV